MYSSHLLWPVEKEALGGVVGRVEAVSQEEWIQSKRPLSWWTTNGPGKGSDLAVLRSWFSKHFICMACSTARRGNQLSSGVKSQYTFWFPLWGHNHFNIIMGFFDRCFCPEQARPDQQAAGKLCLM
ncbi:unnamed protein product [Arctogadus glacialis]